MVLMGSRLTSSHGGRTRALAPGCWAGRAVPLIRQPIVKVRGLIAQAWACRAGAGRDDRATVEQTNLTLWPVRAGHRSAFGWLRWPACARVPVTPAPPVAAGRRSRAVDEGRGDGRLGRREECG